MFGAQAVRILVASPSDVQAERAVVEEVIHEWNALNSEAQAVVVLPVRWETHSHPSLAGPAQQVLNEQMVDRCDVLVGCFWTRIGTPTESAVSGTAEEIERFRAAGKPVLLYFSAAPVLPTSIDTRQWEALVAYRDELKLQGLIGEYPDLANLRTQLMHAITRVVRDTFSAEGPGELTTPVTVPITSALAQYRQDLLHFVERARAEWTVSKGEFDADGWRWLAQRSRDRLLDLQAQLSVYLDDPEAAVVSDLSTLAGVAHTLVQHQYYLDGGRSVDLFSQTMDRLLADLRNLASEDWSSYVISRLPPDAASNAGI